MIPSAMEVKMILVPPIEIIGRVKPVAGTRCTETAIFASACITKLRLKPMAKKVPKAFGLRVTKATVRKNRVRYKPKTARPPNHPYSSQIRG